MVQGLKSCLLHTLQKALSCSGPVLCSTWRLMVFPALFGVVSALRNLNILEPDWELRGRQRGKLEIWPLSWAEFIPAHPQVCSVVSQLALNLLLLDAEENKEGNTNSFTVFQREKPCLILMGVEVLKEEIRFVSGRSKNPNLERFAEISVQSGKASPDSRKGWNAAAFTHVCQELLTR